jgi:hypothetical protein
MTDTQAKPTLEIQRNRAEQQARPDLEKWRNEAEQQAVKTLDKDAIAAIEQTVQAIDSITAGKTADALKGIEEATGKVNIMLARNPGLALIPVSVEALIIDTAPRDIDEIKKLAKSASAPTTCRWAYILLLCRTLRACSIRTARPPASRCLRHSILW